MLKTFLGRTIFITGHTGFKGSWLTKWLLQLGAKVVGYSLPPPTNPSAFELMHIEDKITHIEGDIRDLDSLTQAIQACNPSLIFHLAAKSLVLPSYQNPVDTFSTNAQGTVHVLEAIRNCPSVEAAVLITTDKCYENKGWLWGYRETDSLGGEDPYSASKAMAELAIASYRKSFFQTGHAPQIASVRAGNVIGGGDFSLHRLLPDLIRSFGKNESAIIRNPKNIRPWQFVLEPLSGYLLLAKHLLEQDPSASDAWNFGPKEQVGISVETIANRAAEIYESASWKYLQETNAPKEMHSLRLSWEKAATKLGWAPSLDWEEALDWTMEWHKAHKEGENLETLTIKHLEKYTKKIEWLSPSSPYETASL